MEHNTSICDGGGGGADVSHHTRSLKLDDKSRRATNVSVEQRTRGCSVSTVHKSVSHYKAQTKYEYDLIFFLDHVFVSGLSLLQVHF